MEFGKDDHTWNHSAFKVNHDFFFFLADIELCQLLMWDERKWFQRYAASEQQHTVMTCQYEHWWILINRFLEIAAMCGSDCRVMACWPPISGSQRPLLDETQTHTFSKNTVLFSCVSARCRWADHWIKCVWAETFRWNKTESSSFSLKLWMLIIQEDEVKLVRGW